MISGNNYFTKFTLISIIIVIMVLTSGCIYETPKPYSGAFVITHIEKNDGTYWVYPSTYEYTLKVSMGNGESATVYASQYFINRHQLNEEFSDTTQRLQDYNNHDILIFSSDTPDETRADHPETQSNDGCPVGFTGNVIRVAYVTNYHDIPKTGAHYWAYYDPDGSSKSYLTFEQLTNHINQSEGKYRTDCIYLSYQTHDYWENDAGPEGGYDGEKLATALPKMAAKEVNFAEKLPEQTITTVPTRTPTPSNSNPMYGCPGCPSNFINFARDMCSRGLGLNTVSDGLNTIQCSEVVIDNGEQK